MAGGSVVGVLVWITFPAKRGLKSIQITVQREDERHYTAMTKHEVFLRAKVSRETLLHFTGFLCFTVNIHERLRQMQNSTPVALTYPAAVTSVWPKIKA